MISPADQMITQYPSSYVSELLTSENEESTLKFIIGGDKAFLFKYTVLGRALSKLLTTQYSSFTCKLVHATLKSVQPVTYADLIKQNSFKENQFLYIVNNETIFGFSFNSGRKLLNQDTADSYITPLDQYYLYESYGNFLIQQFFNLHYWTDVTPVVNDIQEKKNISEIKVNSENKYVLMKFKLKINDYQDSDIWILNNYSEVF